MTRARLRSIAVAVIITLAAGAIATNRFGGWRNEPAAPPDRPVLLLLTSLPLMFGEDFSLQRNGSPALDALESRYRVVPISVADPAELAKGRLLLMAQPRAQAPENLVALDDWVRSGGRLLLLADPLLEWPSELPLGDRRRPPLTFGDTGLLAHWGLELAAPDERGPKRTELAGRPVLAMSPGRLSGACQISADGVAADCRIGSGRAAVVADADFLDVADLGPEASRNLEALLAQLDAIG